VGLPKDKFCLACFTGHYPLPVQLEMDKLALERLSPPPRSLCDSEDRSLPLE
jgi:hypothetical protein